MKKITLILLLAILGIGVQAQEPNSSKTVVDTTVNVNYKFTEFEKYVVRGIADLKRYAAQEKQQTGKITFRPETKALIKNAELFLDEARIQFSTEVITPSIIDTVQIKAQIKEIRLKIIDLKDCEICDTVRVSEQIKTLKKESRKYKAWLDQ